jgi:glycosyltransferase involved in cell wall biosynthesis
MPNKLFEYAMAGLPVIVSNVQEMSAFVKKHQMGTILISNTVEDVSHAIDKLLNMDLTMLGQNSRKAALENSWERQETKMKKVYQSFLKSAL